MDTEWTVVNDKGFQVPLGRSFKSLEEAQEYYEWLVGERRDLLIKEAALEDLKQSNRAHRRWEEEQKRTYEIVRREVTPWVRIRPGTSGESADNQFPCRGWAESDLEHLAHQQEED